MGKHNPNGRYDAAEASYIENVSGGRFDASASAFLARELAYIRTRVLEVEKAPLKAFEVFPVQTDVPPGAASAIQRIYDTMGVAKIIANYADDLPRADVAGQEISVPVVTVGDSYGYNVVEIEHAQFSGVNLSEYKARAARRAIDRKIDDMAWNGDSAHGIVGFLNNPNLTQVVIKADGNSNGGVNSTRFIHKTSDQIIRDVNELINAIDIATNDVEFPDTILLPTAAYDYMVMTPRSQYTDMTILGFLREVHPDIRFMKVGELNGAAADGSDLMVAGRFTPEVIRLEIPERLRQLPVEKRNLEYVVDCISRVIGVTITIPLAFSKAAGV